MDSVICAVSRTGGIRQRLQAIIGHGTLSYMTGFTVTSTRSATWLVLFALSHVRMPTAGYKQILTVTQISQNV